MEQLNNIIRVGKVSSVDGKTGTARVAFPDKDNMVSYDLPVIVHQTLKNKDYIMPDVGEQVVCVFLPSSIQQGFIIGSIYSQKDKPAVSDPDKRRIDFADGSWVEYDRKEKVLNINAVESLNVFAKELSVKAKNITIRAEKQLSVAAETASLSAPKGITISATDITGTGVQIQGKIDSGSW